MTWAASYSATNTSLMANTAAMKYSLLRIPKAPKVEQYDLGDVHCARQFASYCTQGGGLPLKWGKNWCNSSPGEKCNSELWVLNRAVHCTVEERGGGVTWKGPIESRASRGSGSWQPCALYSSHGHIAIPVMRWMTTQLKVGISQLSKLLGPAIVKIVTICKKLARDHLSYALYSSHRQILVMICMALARG